MRRLLAFSACLAVGIADEVPLERLVGDAVLKIEGGSGGPLRIMAVLRA